MSCNYRILLVLEDEMGKLPVMSAENLMETVTNRQACAEFWYCVMCKRAIPAD